MVLVAGLWTFSAAAQTVPPFEVASMRTAVPVTAEQRQAGMLPSHFIVDIARVDIGGFPLRNLIQFAFGVPVDQIDGPAWISDVKFDIKANPPAGATRQQLPQMMQQLLIERLDLKFHRESRDRDVYALVVGKNGLKVQELPQGTPAELKPSLLPNGIMRADITNTFAGIASFMSPYVDSQRPVVDLTGEPGVYHLTIDVNRDEARASFGDNASLYAQAIEQYGLKLERRKIVSEAVIVDGAEKVPKEN